LFHSEYRSDDADASRGIELNDPVPVRDMAVRVDDIRALRSYFRW
jgi:hypothetical protein